MTSEKRPRRPRWSYVSRWPYVSRRSHTSRRSGRLHGWGGVSTMAGACALTAALALPQLPHAATERSERAAQRTATAVPAQTDACTDPEPVPPSDDNNAPGVKAIRDRQGNARKLIVGVDQNSYRWGSRNPDTGELEGFDIDLAKAIAADILGSERDITFRAIPTEQREEALAEGTVDLVVRTMTITCERSETVTFSTPYFQVGQQVLVPKGSPVTGFDETLRGKRVCTAKKSTAYTALKKKSYGAVFDKPEYIVANQLDCLVRLQLGKVDAVVTDNALAAGQAAQDPDVELVGEPLPPEYYGVAAELGNDDLVGRVNHVLEEYRAGGKDSRWMKSYDTWLKAGLPGITEPPVVE